MTNQNSHANNYVKISAPLHPRTPLSHQIWTIVKVDSEIIGGRLAPVPPLAGATVLAWDSQVKGEFFFRKGITLFPSDN